MNFDREASGLEDIKPEEKMYKANLRIKEVADSYITKEKFIQMIQTLDFKYIESSRLHFVSGFKYEEEKDIVKTIGYDISID